MHLRATLRQLHGQTSIKTTRPSEQVPLSGAGQYFGEGLLGSLFQLVQRSLGHPGFQSGQLPHQPALVRPARHHHLAAQPGELGSHRTGRWPKPATHRIEQRVSLADEAVEIREWLDRGRILRRVARDHREPEPKLGEPYRRGIAIHPEQVALQNPAADRGAPGATHRR